jgi:hypothetical protein
MQPTCQHKVESKLPSLCSIIIADHQLEWGASLINPGPPILADLRNSRAWQCLFAGFMFATLRQVDGKTESLRPVCLAIKYVHASSSSCWACAVIFALRKETEAWWTGGMMVARGQLKKAVSSVTMSPVSVQCLYPEPMISSMIFKFAEKVR